MGSIGFNICNSTLTPLFPSLLSTRAVQNVGSTARDHLANERTLLAWVRTALSLIALGLAIAKFSPDTSGTVVSAVLVFCGVMLIVYGRFRYFQVLFAIEEGLFLLNTGGGECEHRDRVFRVGNAYSRERRRIVLALALARVTFHYDSNNNETK